MHSLKLFATVPSLQLEMGVWADYDHPWTIAGTRR
jgi:hypothetical protein